MNRNIPNTSQIWEHRDDRALSMAYWETLRLQAEALELMKFTLIYDDELPPEVIRRSQSMPLSFAISCMCN